MDAEGPVRKWSLSFVKEVRRLAGGGGRMVQTGSERIGSARGVWVDKVPGSKGKRAGQI